MELKRITDVTLKDTLDYSDTEHVIIEDDGEAKRVPTKLFQTGGGSGFDLVITGKAVVIEEEGSGSGGGSDTVYFIPDPETVEVETSLTFDELKAKWSYMTALVGFDTSESGITSMTVPFSFSAIYPSYDSMLLPVFSITAEQVASFEENWGLTLIEGEDYIIFAPEFSSKWCDEVEESGESGFEAYMQCAFICSKGSNGEIVITTAGGGK